MAARAFPGPSCGGSARATTSGAFSPMGASQKIGGGRADDAAADDGHVVFYQIVPLSALVQSFKYQIQLFS
jgi:hypothetical protein